MSNVMSNRHEYSRRPMLEHAEWRPCEVFSISSSTGIPEDARGAWQRFYADVIHALQRKFPTYAFTFDQTDRSLLVTRVFPDGTPARLAEYDPIPEVRYHSIDAYNTIAGILRALDLGETPAFGKVPVPRRAVLLLQTHFGGRLIDVVRFASDRLAGPAVFNDRDRRHIDEQFAWLSEWIASRISDGTLLPKLVERYPES